MKTTILLLSALASLSAFAAPASKLSPETIAKISRFYTNQGLGDGDSYTINPSRLPATARAEYDRLESVRNCRAYGYCPEAYAINAYGTDTFAVGVSDDGGISFTVYTFKGQPILGCSAGESSEMTCGE
jgi:hypothetical protein